jgi:DNA-binding transcriptional LysR family regulator
MRYRYSIELNQVEAFLAVARCGGFTAASPTLHLSQPAISRRIQLLERELGAPLFERLPGGLTLTDAGRAFVPHAEAVVASMRDGHEAVHAVRDTEVGTVTLAMVGTLASTAVADRLRQFRDTHPATDLQIRTALSLEVSALVRRGDATLGLRYRSDPDTALVSTIIYDEPLVPVCSPRHRFARRKVEPQALVGERWLAFPARPGNAPEPYSTSITGWLVSHGLDESEVVVVDSLTAQKRMAEAGFGLALLPASGIDEELRCQTLVKLRLSGTGPTVPVALIHRRAAFQSGAMRSLIDLLSAWPKRSR